VRSMGFIHKDPDYLGASVQQLLALLKKTPENSQSIRKAALCSLSRIGMLSTFAIADGVRPQLSYIPRGAYSSLSSVLQRCRRKSSCEMGYINWFR
jgi:hypothetical protein